MKCKHTDVIVVPTDIIKTEHNGVDGFAINLYGDGKLSCRHCQEELPYEDLQLYEQDHVSVGIPAEMVDGDD